MIPIKDHETVFRQAKSGHKFEFVINRVPNSHLNRYIGRTGKIHNIRMKGNRIAWLDISVDSLMYGKWKLVSFPVEHITLIKPVIKKTYANYDDYEQDNILDEYNPNYNDDDEPDSSNIYDDEDPEHDR
jgi:hypothetical protein